MPGLRSPRPDPSANPGRPAPVTNPVSLAVLLTVVTLVAAIVFAAGIAVSVLIGLHAEHVATTTGRKDTQEIIAADEKAALGRSKTLCVALKEMAVTPAAHKLHPVFVRVYQGTQCHQITGLLPAIDRHPPKPPHKRSGPHKHAANKRHR